MPRTEQKETGKREKRDKLLEKARNSQGKAARTARSSATHAILSEADAHRMAGLLGNPPAPNESLLRAAKTHRELSK